MTTKTNNNGIYLSLVSQLDKLARHNRQGSFRTKERYYLATNAELGIELERRRFGDTDRTWSNAEFNRMLAKAMVSEKDDFILTFYLARYAGLRIHECFIRIDTAIAEQMLREGAITIKGKGGKVRTVPVNEQITSAMKKCLDITERGHKLLGHERADVTNIYLASTNGGKKQA